MKWDDVLPQSFISRLRQIRYPIFQEYVHGSPSKETVLLKYSQVWLTFGSSNKSADLYPAVNNSQSRSIHQPLLFVSVFPPIFSPSFKHRRAIKAAGLSLNFISASDGPVAAGIYGLLMGQVFSGSG